MGKLLNALVVDLRDTGSAALKVAYPGREKQMKIRYGESAEQFAGLPHLSSQWTVWAVA
jgi:hypothetical protein